MSLYVRRFLGSGSSGGGGTPPPVGGGGGDITFTTPPKDVSVVVGGNAVFNWAASSPSGAPLSYQVETKDEAGVGTGGTGWWNFGTVTSPTFTFSNLQLSDTNTLVRFTASNGTDGNGIAYASITVTAAGSTAPAASFSDPFTRADGTNIALSAPVAWTEYEFSGAVSTAWEISGNALRFNLDEWSGAIAGDTTTANHYSECTVAGLVGTTEIAGPAVRCNATFTEGYMAVAFGGLDGRVRLYKSTGVYSPTFVADTGVIDMTGTRVIRLEADGGTIRILVDGNLQLSQTVTDYLTNTRVGVAANGAVGTLAKIDTYSAGALGSAPPTTGGGTPIVLGKVYFAGHSLMKEGFTNPFSLDNLVGDTLHTPSYIATACTAQSIVCDSTLIGESGATVFALRTAINANSAQWSDCSTMVIDCIINGDETAAAFKAEALLLVSDVEAVVPGMNIVWVEGHAHPTSASTLVNDRWQAKNPKLYEMLNAGTIKGVVPWATYAAANLGVYVADGVHHWNDQAPYADQMVAKLVQLSAAAPPPSGSGGLPSRHMGFDNYSTTHFGNPQALTGPGNYLIKDGTQLAFPFKAVTTSSITHASFNIKYNNTNGYSGGTFGKLRCQLFATTADGSPTGSSLGQFVLNSVVAPDGNTNNGNVGKWAFSSAIPVTQGNPYALVIDNVDASPGSNYFSINLMVEYPEPHTQEPDFAYQDIATGNGFFWPRFKGGSSYWNPTGGTSWNSYYRTTHWLNWHSSCMEVYFTSGVRQGQAYVGARYGDAAYEMDALSGSTRYRMSALSKRAGRTATHVNYKTGKHSTLWPSGTTYGFVLRSAAGTSLATATIAQNGAWWGKGALSASVAIAADTTYLMDIYHLAGTTMGFRAMQTSLNGHGWDADGQSNLPGGGLFRSTDGGVTFTQPGSGAAYSMSLFLNTTA